MFKTIFFVVVLTAAGLVTAHGAQVGDIAIGHPYARATVPGQRVGGAYMTFQNKGKDDRLLSASANVSAAVELHSMSMEGNVMHMQQVPNIALPAGKLIELKPGGFHVMLTGLKAPLKAGESFPMTLKFEKAGDVTVEVKIEGAAAAMEMDHGQMKH